MAASHFILLIESDSVRTEALAAQLVALGVEPIRVADLADAVAMVKSREYAIAAVVLPSDLPGRLVGKAMKSMRRREPALPAMAYGKVPEAKQATALERAGVLLALWDGYDRAMLRFQLNRLVSGDGTPVARGAKRAPVHAPVRVAVGGREKDGMLYSVSPGGCFIETPRASMEGARVELSFEIGDRSYLLHGEVVFSNVPGNLQRPNLPLGMGVRFVDCPEASREHLEQFVQQRMEALEI